MSTIFTGFDSAWGGKAPGAICDLKLSDSPQGETLSICSDPVLVRWRDALAHFSDKYSKVRRHIVAIDQGLVVPNQKGMRPVERNLARALMSKYRCGAHSSNRGNSACYGPDAGIWKLLEQLEGSGYRQSPESIVRSTQSDARYFFECYPHPAIIGLFDLDRTLQYKVHKHNQEDWAMLVEKVRGLATASLPIVNVGEFVSEEFLQCKANEDKLDSIVAAFTAAWLWKYGWEKSMCLGDELTGYLVTPVSEDLQTELLKVFPPHAEIDLNIPATTAENNSFLATCAPAGEPISVVDAANATGSATDALMRITDSGCLWGNANAWMERALCVGHVLEIDIVGVPEEPRVIFGPFANAGTTQFGMRLNDEDSKLIWKHLAEGASKENVTELEIKYRYRKMPTVEVKACEEIV